MIDYLEQKKNIKTWWSAKGKTLGYEYNVTNINICVSKHNPVSFRM